ncbi:MAG: hypothetical protein ACQES8_09890 [Thermodesulfobacteriota bacterium]
MPDPKECTLYNSGLRGAETAFGEIAEKWGVNEVNFTFEGHQIFRNRNVQKLSEEELARGDISMELVSKLMQRTYYEKKKIRKVIQMIFHMVNKGYQVFTVGSILADNTVRGGTGWAVELAKLFNRPLSVFDQDKQAWYTWIEGKWQSDSPRITYTTFAGTGTRYLSDAGREAIEELFKDSFANS